jgi:hypothetical protein
MLAEDSGLKAAMPGQRRPLRQPDFFIALPARKDKSDSGPLVPLKSLRGSVTMSHG